MYALTNCTIYSTEGVLTHYALIINDGIIEKLLPQQQLDDKMSVINLNGAVVSPGFIDLQLNGCGGVMFNGAETLKTLQTMHAANLKSGTTSFLPTLITASDESMHRALAAVRDYMASKNNEVLGLHLEGPYLSTAKKGIHRAEYIRQPDPTMVALICENNDIVSMLTVAPETCSNEVIEQISTRNIVVSLGHSNASYTQSKMAIEHGAGCATHLFNAMSPMTGREPGVVGAVYDQQLYAGIIVDGFHVAYENIRISKRILADKLFIVTDATAAAGATIEHFDFVGNTVYYQDGRCVATDGTLGGSAVTMIESIQQLVEKVGIELAEAIRMASLYPARVIGVDNELGSIAAGKVANLAIFDSNYKVKASVVNGVYQPN